MPCVMDMRVIRLTVGVLGHSEMQSTDDSSLIKLINERNRFKKYLGEKTIDIGDG